MDGRYITSTRDRLASSSELGWLQVELAPRSLEEAAASAVTRDRLRAVGVEAVGHDAEPLRSPERRCSAAADGSGAAARLVPTEQVVETARMIKDAEELATLRRAGAMLSKVAAEVLALVEPAVRR